MNIKVETALKAYAKGCTCSQAVIAAYVDELGITKENLYRMMEGYGSGFGGAQEVCGAFAAACMVISFLNSDGNDTGLTKHDTYEKITEARMLFTDIYKSIRCIEIMHGEKPKPLKCGQKVKDAVRCVEEYRKKYNK